MELINSVSLLMARSHLASAFAFSTANVSVTEMLFLGSIHVEYRQTSREANADVNCEWTLLQVTVTSRQFWKSD